MYRGLWPYYILFLQSLADPKFFWKCSLELKQHSFPSIFHDALFLIIFLRIVVDRTPFAHHTKFFFKSIRLCLYTDIYYYLMMTLVYILFILQFFCFSKIIYLNFSSSKKYRNLLYSSGFQDCELNLLSQRSLSQTRTEIILGLSVSAQRSRQRDRSALKIGKNCNFNFIFKSKNQTARTRIVPIYFTTFLFLEHYRFQFKVNKNIYKD